MIFGLFKKSVTADIVFKGGRIYTLDADLPWAEAVACKDGRIIAVGDNDTVENFEGSDTEVVDLDGGVLLPGFIDTCAHPVLQAFQSVCLILYDDMPISEVLDTLQAYIVKNPGKSGYFAYGFNTELILNKPAEETQLLLDNICMDKPVAMLDISGTEGWFNTKAMDLVRAAVAEESETPVITLSYVLHVLSPINFDLLQNAVIALAAEYCKKGYTTVFDCGSPDYLHAIYQEMLVEMLQVDMLKQRFIGSYLITRNIAPDYIIRKLLQKQTSCAEIEDCISCSTLKLIVVHLDQAPDSVRISKDMLKILAIKAAERGFKVHIDAVGKGSVTEALEAVFLARAAGNRKAHFIIAHSHNLTEQEKIELLHNNEVCEAIPTLGDFHKKYRNIDNADDVADAIDKLTIDAAVQLGISDEYGSIENGKRADFVIFKENPLSGDLQRFRGLSAAMTVIEGNIVYEAGEDNPESWQAILKEGQQEIQKQILLEEEEDPMY